MTYALFVPYLLYRVKPKFEEGARFVPEDRLPPAMIGALWLPVSLFWFGWTSEASVPWIVPILGSVLFTAGTFLLFQAGLNYLQDWYVAIVHGRRTCCGSS